MHVFDSLSCINTRSQHQGTRAAFGNEEGCFGSNPEMRLFRARQRVRAAPALRAGLSLGLERIVLLFLMQFCYRDPSGTEDLICWRNK